MSTRPLLPNEVRSPLVLIAVHLISQTVLAGLLWRAWNLVAGELDAAGRQTYLCLFGLQAGLTILAVAVGGLLWRRAGRVHALWGLAFFVLNVAFLWFALARSAQLVPASVAGWMLSPAHVIFILLCLLTPAMFHAALCVAGTPLPVSRGLDIGGSVVTLVLIPVAWYLFAGPGHRFFTHVNLPFAVGLALFVASTALVTFVFLRLLMWLCRVPRKPWMVSLLAGVALPLAGLALNRTIPFPVDLQFWPVYALTLLNGLVLVIPLTGPPAARFAIWLARVAMFPFSLYFFVLFLPFLPLSILAMIAAGAGFLVLAPTFLFVWHVRLVFVEAHDWRARLSLPLAIVAAAVALAVMPAAYLGRAALHRQALMGAVDAVFAPDLGQARLPVSPGRTRSALIRLQRMKEGLYLPFLSEIYNGIVFNGMVLPDHKVKTIGLALCGEDLSIRPERDAGREIGLMEMFSNNRARMRRWTQARPPPREVVLRDVQVTALTTNGPLVEARLVLDLENRDGANAEYVGTLELPPWMRVSGFELDVAGAWVEGRLFDRKSAMWVYHMIRDETRLDPGLLTETDGGAFELRVFPFASGQRRPCAIRVCVPAGEEAWVRIGDRRVELAPGGPVPAPLLGMPLPDGGAALFVSPGQAAALPAITRPVRFHFLLDVSHGSADAWPEYPRRVRQFLERHPWAPSAMATAVHFDSLPLASAGTEVDTLIRSIERLADRVRPAGGYCVDLAIRRCMWAELAAEAPADHATVYVRIGGEAAVTLDALDPWWRLIPDGQLVDDAATLTPHGRPIVWVRTADAWSLWPAETGGWAFSALSVEQAVFEAGAADAPVRLVPNLHLAGEAPWAAVGALSQMADARLRDPRRADAYRRPVLQQARASGILAPGTAYIVVENSAQWRALERAEKQSLAAHGALEFDEFVTPEPEVWLVLAGFMAWQAWRRQRSSGDPRGLGDP